MLQHMKVRGPLAGLEWVDPWDERRLSGSMGSTLTCWTTSQTPINNVYTQKNKQQSEQDRQQVLPTPELQEHLNVQTMHSLCS